MDALRPTRIGSPTRGLRWRYVDCGGLHSFPLRSGTQNPRQEPEFYSVVNIDNTMAARVGNLTLSSMTNMSRVMPVR